MVSIKPFVDDEMLRRPHIETWRPRYHDASWRHVTDTDVGRRLRVPWLKISRLILCYVTIILFSFNKIVVFYEVLND